MGGPPGRTQGKKLVGISPKGASTQHCIWGKTMSAKRGAWGAAAAAAGAMAVRTWTEGLAW